MIHEHSNETQTRWDRGDFRVRLEIPTSADPIGFCDGSDEDIAALQSRADAESAGAMHIDRKTLKTGREIWTLRFDG